MITFLLNPASGAQQQRPLDLPALLRAHLLPGVEWRVRTTEYPGHATELARAEAAAGATVVVAVGGDGTVNEVGAGLLGTTTALGIIPRGSGNGLARHLRVPLNVTEAARHVAQGKQSAIDAGMLNGRPFFCTAGLGFDGHVARAFAQSQTRGLRTYAALVLREFGRYEAPAGQLQITDEAGVPRHTHQIRRLFALTFANAAQYGNNAFIAPMADIQDGVLDACVLEKPGTWPGALTIAAALLARALPRLKAATYFPLTRATVTLPAGPLPSHIDGEYAGDADRFEVSILPGALRVVGR